MQIYSEVSTTVLKIYDILIWLKLLYFCKVLYFHFNSTNLSSLSPTHPVPLSHFLDIILEFISRTIAEQLQNSSVVKSLYLYRFRNFLSFSSNILRYYIIVSQNFQQIEKQVKRMSEEQNFKSWKQYSHMVQFILFKKFSNQRKMYMQREGD